MSPLPPKRASITKKAALDPKNALPKHEGRNNLWGRKKAQEQARLRALRDEGQSQKGGLKKKVT